MKTTQRILALLVTTVFVAAALVGCASSPAQTTAATNAPTQAATPAPATPAPTVAPPVTLTVYFTQGIVPLTPGVQDDPVAKEIEKATGVTMDVQLWADDKTKVMVASGDLADVTQSMNVTDVNSMITAGSVMPLDDYLGTAMDLQKNADKAIKYSRENVSNGTGKLYAILERSKKNAVPLQASQQGVFLRWDYYKELGCPAINSPDDLITVIAAMQKNHPTTPDGKKVYGLSTQTTWGPSAAWAQYTYLGKYSGLVGINAFADFNIKTNEYIPLLDDRNMIWRGVDFYNKANRAGILDPESFTQNYDALSGKYTAGQILSVYTEWMITQGNSDLAKSTNGTATYVDIPMPDTQDYAAFYSRKSPLGMTVRMLVVSSKCKNPQKAVDLIDYLCSDQGARTILSGVQGRTWDVKDGKVAALPEAIQSYATSSDYRKSEGIHKYEGIVGLDYDAQDANGQFLDVFLDPSAASAAYTAAQKDYIQHYGAKDLLDVIGKRTTNVTMDETITVLIPPLDADMNRIQTKIQDYLTANLPKLVMAKDDATFKALKDQMFADIKAMEIDTLNAFEEAAFKSAVEKASTY